MHCWVDSIAGCCRARLGTIRYRDLPEAMLPSGALQPLDLSSDTGLVEKCHVIFFAGNILGADFNFYGPRVTRLAEYMQVIARGICPLALSFHLLLRGNAASELARFGTIRLLRLRTRASSAGFMANLDKDVNEALGAAFRVGGTEDAEIVLRSKRSRNASLAQSLISGLKSLVARPDLPEHFETLKVRGRNAETGALENLDLLSDKLVTTRKIMRIDDRYRVLDSDSAYAAIESAYNELQEEISIATEILE